MKSTKIRTALDDRLRSMARGEKLQQYVLGVEYMSDHKSIMGYETNHTQFLKVHLAMPTLVPTLKRVCEDGIDLPGILRNGVNAGTTILSPFESNVPFVLRFMVDRDISGAGWISLLENTYQIRPASKKETHCQVSQ